MDAHLAVLHFVQTSAVKILLGVAECVGQSKMLFERDLHPAIIQCCIRDQRLAA